MKRDKRCHQDIKRNIHELVDVILNDFGQESVIVELVRDGEIEEVGQYVWEE